MSTDNDKMVQYLEAHLQENPNTILFARLADIYLKKKKVEKAIQVCEEGIKKHPYYVTGHMVLGKCYLANKHFDQAEKEFKRVLLFDPKYLSAHKYYGDLMQEIGWENTCEMSYKKILQIDPLDEVARSRVGEFELEDRSKLQDMESYVPEFTESEVEGKSAEKLPLSTIEEDVLYQDEEQQFDEPTSEPAVMDIDIDDKKAEEFSSILDEIFEDEVVKDEDQSHTKSEEQFLSEENLISEYQKAPDNYCKNNKPIDDSIKKPSSDFNNDLNQFDKIDLDQFSEEEKQKKPELDVNEIKKSSYQPQSNKKSDGEKIVTPTLGEIYAAQGQYSKAISVFELLLKKHPDNEVFAQKIEILMQKLEESKNAPKN